MSLVLILMRHAKSSWNDPHLSDFERPLNKRGYESAENLGDWIRHESLIPDEALISSSRRTVETFDGLGLELTPKMFRSLYMAGPKEMLHTLSGARKRCVLMISHNPGIAELARMLVTQLPTHIRFIDYPTGATLVMNFEQKKWSEIRSQSGQVIHFVTPRELTQEVFLS